MPHRWEIVPPYLCCPVCRDEIVSLGQALRCERGHSFDVARDGYVNLLVSPKRHSPTVGDSRSMLRARQAFLAGGHYARLADAVIALALERVEKHGPYASELSVVDIGCGDGYYLNALHEALQRRFLNGQSWLCGLDVSREAVCMAAKGRPELYFVVADVTRGLPVADASVDAALNIFAPRNSAEFARIIRPDGTLLVVIPTDRHLSSLRSQLPLLAVEPNKLARVQAQLAGAFVLSHRETLEIELSLSELEVASLIEMTPAARYLTAQDRARLAIAGPQRTQASFEILQFRRSR